MNAGIAYPMAHLGIIGTGLLAIPVLAGSTAYAIGEGRKWPVGLSRKPKRAVAFYSVLAISAVIGIGLNSRLLTRSRRFTGARSSTVCSRRRSW